MENSSELNFKERLWGGIRTFNRQVFNPFALSFAGRPGVPWSAVIHSGRTTGKEYITPVLAAYLGDSFVVPLPYGKRVDWLKNVLASGGGKVIYQGRVYRALQPEVRTVKEGAETLPDWMNTMLRQGPSTGSILRFNKVHVPEDSNLYYQAFSKMYPLSHGLWILAAVAVLLIGMRRLFVRRK